MLSGPIDNLSSHSSQISSHSLYTPVYNSPIESPLVTNNIATSMEGHFPMSTPLLPVKSVGTHLMTENPQNALAPAASNSIEGDSHFIPLTLDIAQTALEIPMQFSEEDIISFALVAEEAVGSPTAPLPVPPSHLHSPQTLHQVQTLSPVPIPVTTPTTVQTDDSSITKAKEGKSRPRNLQKESFAARHRIPVESSSIPTSGSPSLVHRTRRGRPSGSSTGGEFSTKFPGVPPSAPVDPRPAARRARQRKRNGGGDESYGGPEKKFKCDHCGQTFGRKEHVKRHVSGIHQQVKGKTLLYVFLCLLTCSPQLISVPSVECVALAPTTSDNTCALTSEMATLYRLTVIPFLCCDSSNIEHFSDGNTVNSCLPRFCFISFVHCAPSPHPTTHTLPVPLSSFCLSVAPHLCASFYVPSCRL